MLERYIDTTSACVCVFDAIFIMLTNCVTSNTCTLLVNLFFIQLYIPIFILPIYVCKCFFVCNFKSHPDQLHELLFCPTFLSTQFNIHIVLCHQWCVMFMFSHNIIEYTTFINIIILLYYYIIILLYYYIIILLYYYIIILLYYYII